MQLAYVNERSRVNASMTVAL